MADHKRILVVDDDAEIRKSLTTVLRRRGLVVDEAANGREARQLLLDETYAVILLDLFMPQTDGFEVLRALDGEESQSTPVVLVVTGADRRTIESLDSQFIHGVIRKPFDPEEIASLVVACSEVKGRGTFGTMAIATMLSGAQMLHWLVNK